MLLHSSAFERRPLIQIIIIIIICHRNCVIDRQTKRQTQEVSRGPRIIQSIKYYSSSRDLGENHVQVHKSA